MSRIALVLAFALFAAGPALAQTAAPADTVGAPDNRCWSASQSYSPGATARFGTKVYSCQFGNSWVDAGEGVGANCIYDDRNYGVGAIIAVTGAQGVTVACQPDGTWKRPGTK